jgi:restriction system protein
VYRVSLVSFQVFYQAKRWRNAVGAKEVRDFRGAMAGRGEKGLLITTSTFTNDAKAESTRDGAPPVDLVDGTALCDLLVQHRLGVVCRSGSNWMCRLIRRPWTRSDRNDWTSGR